MNIIDEKGRLFGKINIIDFLVIVFLVSLIPMFYFGYKLSDAKKLAQRALEAQLVLRKFVEIEIFCNLVEVPSALLKSIIVGDKETGENGQGIGEITWIGEPKTYKYTYNFGTQEDGKLRKIYLENRNLNELPARIKLIAEARGTDLYYNAQGIRIDSPFIFKTDKYAVKVMPIEVYLEGNY